MMSIPNILTFFRILLVPIMVIVYYLPWSESSYWAGGVFALAAFTDWLDGYLARRMNSESSLGAFLDPIADKVMVAVALTMIVETYRSVWVAFPAMVIISREIIVSGLREWMAELGKRANVAVSTIGKIKTSTQMMAIMLLIIRIPEWGAVPVIVAYTMLYLSVALTIYSMLIYLKAAWPHLTSGSKTG